MFLFRKKEAKMILRRKVLIKKKRKRNINNKTEDNYKDKGIKQKTKKEIIKKLITKGHTLLKSLKRLNKKPLEKLLKTFIESGCKNFQIQIPRLEINVENVL